MWRPSTPTGASPTTWVAVCEPKEIRETLAPAPSDIACAINDLFDRHGSMPMTADMGDCLFTAMEIENTELAAPGYYAGMGFGLGYAMAEDNVCEIIERYVTVSGERAKFFGLKDLTLNNMHSDFSMMHERLAYRVYRELGLVAPRPLYTALASERGWPMPPLEDALGRYVREHPVFGERARPRRARKMIAAGG